MTAPAPTAELLKLAKRLRAAAISFEGQRAWHANAIDGDCEPHDSWQIEMEDASKAAIEAADLLTRQAASVQRAEPTAHAYEPSQHVGGRCAVCGGSPSAFVHAASVERAEVAGDAVREAAARIIAPAAFTQEYVHYYPDRSTVEQFTAFEKADAILALASPPRSEGVRASEVRIVQPDYEVAARALGFKKLDTGNWVHPNDDAHFPRRFASAKEIFDKCSPGAAQGSPDLVDKARAWDAVIAARKDEREKCLEVIGNMRQSEAGMFDAKHSGQRGCDRSDTLYDAYVAIKGLAQPSADREGA